MKKFPSEISEQLKSYVYLYSDPRNGNRFMLAKVLATEFFSHELLGFRFRGLKNPD
ncbi:MAG: hypothetical protein ABR955_14625 [Verrucomicrobiota bacterium]|jgi:hypothetical protein